MSIDKSQIKRHVMSISIDMTYLYIDVSIEMSIDRYVCSAMSVDKSLDVSTDRNIY